MRVVGAMRRSGWPGGQTHVLLLSCQHWVAVGPMIDTDAWRLTAWPCARCETAPPPPPPPPNREHLG